MPKSNSLQINMSAGGGEKRPLADKVPDFEFKDHLGYTWLLSSPIELHRLVVEEDIAQLEQRLREEEIEEATINATCTIGPVKEVRQKPLSLLPRSPRCILPAGRKSGGQLRSCLEKAPTQTRRREGAMELW